MSAHLPAFVILLTIFLLFGVGLMVGRARGKYHIKAPATTGHPEFERTYRVQMNTLENAVMFLPALWLAMQFASPLIVGILGLIWIAARIWYAAAYIQDAAKRGPSFILSLLAIAGLIVLALKGFVMAIII